MFNALFCSVDITMGNHFFSSKKIGLKTQCGVKDSE